MIWQIGNQTKLPITLENRSKQNTKYNGRQAKLISVQNCNKILSNLTLTNYMRTKMMIYAIPLN